MDLGVAIANRHFVQHQLRSGALVAPFGAGCPTGESYYLTWRKDTTPSAPLLKFLEWIRAHIADGSPDKSEAPRDDQ
ncbi:LysR substrate-binding domain-containing protein [Albirhodobacter sp. R86504]|uniref:LysR substrate-binding domain-containing protein n=1 Tax=Albirhodobacter sp. R86504 TaxID=3093848 RepID=UPI00366EED94